MRFAPYSTLLAACFAIAAFPVRAQDYANAPQLRETLSTLYKLEISQDLCKFDITDAQMATIGRQADDLEDQLGMSEEASTKFYRQLENEMKLENAHGALCSPKGTWAKTFKDELAKLEE